jgi:hypothetical protein
MTRRLPSLREDTEMEQTIGKPAVLERIRLDLTGDEFDLVKSALRLLLVIEDDRETIPQLKELLAKLDAEPASISR